MTDNNGTWSPRSMRILLTVLAVALVVVALVFLSVFSWLWWLNIAIAVVLICAAVTPPFRRPRG